jgi:hypothetical protein
MADVVKLKPGWLLRDVQRAAKRVAQWRRQYARVERERQRRALTSTSTVETRIMAEYPPYYGYDLQTVTIECSCGRQTSYSELWVKQKEGWTHNTWRPSGLSEPIFDLPIERTNIIRATARCTACIDLRERIPVTPRKFEPKAPPQLSLEDLGL